MEYDTNLLRGRDGSHQWKRPRFAPSRNLARKMAQAWYRVLGLLGCVFVQAGGVTASVVQAQIRLLADGALLRGSILVNDLSELPSSPPPADALGEHGFAILRPALPLDWAAQAELEVALKRHNISAALQCLMRSSSFFNSLGYRWGSCALPVKRLAAPDDVEGGSPSLFQEPSWGSVGDAGLLTQVLHAFILRAPSVARLLTIWMPLQIPVQPLAFADERRRWWWPGENVSVGDVFVVDYLFAQQGWFTLPGEKALGRSLLALRKVHAGLADLRRSGALRVENTRYDRDKVRKVVEACGSLDKSVLEPFPFPAVGKRYTIHTEPSALVRKYEAVESDVIAELPPGGIVTILALGTELGRVQVYTEHAVEILGSQVEDGGALLGGISVGARGAITGWMQSMGYDGKPTLHSLESPLPHGEAWPESIQRRTADLGTMLGGICDWVNATIGMLDSLDRGFKTHLPEHSVYILERYLRELDAEDVAAHRVVFETRCIVLSPPMPDVIVAATMTGVALFGGSIVVWSGCRIIGRLR